MEQKKIWDVLIIGSGPAGLQAAIHATGRKASVLVLGRLQKSSASRAHIENYCCIEGREGMDLLQQARMKAEASGAEFVEEDVVALSNSEGIFSAKLEGGRSLSAKTLILAMGVSRNRLGVPGEKEFLGKGVSYCVDCDAAFYKGESVAISGCESAAVSGALTLLFYADTVHLICEKLEVAGPLGERIRESPIRIHEGTAIKEIVGQTAVEGIILDDGTELKVGGVFIELGAKGVIELAGNLGVSMDPDTLKFIETNKKQETSVPGVYAAGDICGPPWQIAKAVGEGCVAGLRRPPMPGKICDDSG